MEGQLHQLFTSIYLLTEALPFLPTSHKPQSSQKLLVIPISNSLRTKTGTLFSHRDGTPPTWHHTSTRFLAASHGLTHLQWTASATSRILPRESLGCSHQLAIPLWAPTSGLTPKAALCQTANISFSSVNRVELWRLT